MVVRMSKTGIINNAEPCHHCMLQLKRATYVNIKNVYYSTKSGGIICKKFDDMVRTPTVFVSSGYRMRMGTTKVRVIEQTVILQCSHQTRQLRSH